MTAGKSSPVPDACAFGVPRAQCHNNCGYRCSRARAERTRYVDPQRVRPNPELPPLYVEPRTASPSVAADHANCGTASCCRRCTPTLGGDTI